ncbi:MarR family winged helix-turn-helix transcriptional regulator [Pseudonocardia sp. H11422]|uniref:MarR family winged helix-turn-helix transcriptional regulator n=1 Tax=Pseudonocardia sp. H11422 TaxID=2835866 RepID=UPI001BDDB136|nr:MarR family transcriptional regulator [Pseudonocardia sp. H11422]
MSRQLEGVLSHDGLSLDQWRVVDLLADGQGRPMTEIAGQIVVPGPTLTKIVDRLVDAALVYRLVDDSDRRRVLVFLSDHGRRLHDRLAAEVTHVEAEILSVLGAESERVLALLAQLAARPRVSPVEQQPSGA